jgi:hypothetical protein
MTWLTILFEMGEYRTAIFLQHANSVLHRYFHVEAGKPEPAKWQYGVVRTNCMDNLDRTNVAQAAIAKWVLNLQLKAAGVFSESDSVDSHEVLSRNIRERTLHFCLTLHCV